MKKFTKSIALVLSLIIMLGSISQASAVMMRVGGTPTSQKYTVNHSTLPLSKYPPNSLYTENWREASECMGFAKYVFDMVWGYKSSYSSAEFKGHPIKM